VTSFHKGDLVESISKNFVADWKKNLLMDSTWSPLWGLVTQVYMTYCVNYSSNKLIDKNTGTQLL